MVTGFFYATFRAGKEGLRWFDNMPTPGTGLAVLLRSNLSQERLDQSDVASWIISEDIVVTEVAETKTGWSFYETPRSVLIIGAASFQKVWSPINIRDILKCPSSSLVYTTTSILTNGHVWDWLLLQLGAAGRGRNDAVVLVFYHGMPHLHWCVWSAWGHGWSYYVHRIHWSRAGKPVHVKNTQYLYQHTTATVTFTELS